MNTRERAANIRKRDLSDLQTAEPLGAEALSSTQPSTSNKRESAIGKVRQPSPLRTRLPQADGPNAISSTTTPLAT